LAHGHILLGKGDIGTEKYGAYATLRGDILAHERWVWRMPGQRGAEGETAERKGDKAMKAGEHSQWRLESLSIAENGSSRHSECVAEQSLSTQ
jgi:hypothetical protein